LKQYAEGKRTVYRVHLNSGDKDYLKKQEAFRQAGNIAAASGVVVAVTEEQQTLHEAIAARGWRSRKEKDEQRRTIYNHHGQRVGSFTAAEAWAHLRQTACCHAITSGSTYVCSTCRERGLA
jgi:hypothetical protein